MMTPNQSDEISDALAGSTPQVALAKGVLVQAKRDLRRFRDASDRIGREMYSDAYSWVASNDFTWPYSFINVCEVLGISPEVLRAELLADSEFGWSSRSRRIAQKLSASFRGSLVGMFAGRRSSRPVLAH